MDRFCENSKENADEAQKQEILKPQPAVNIINCKSASKKRFYLDSRSYISPRCWDTNRDDKRPGDMLKSIAKAGKD